MRVQPPIAWLTTRSTPAARRVLTLPGAIEVLESSVHERESLPRPDLGLLEPLRELSGRRADVERLHALLAGL